MVFFWGGKTFRTYWTAVYEYEIWCTVEDGICHFLYFSKSKILALKQAVLGNICIFKQCYIFNN